MLGVEKDALRFKCRALRLCDHRLNLLVIDKVHARRNKARAWHRPALRPIAMLKLGEQSFARPRFAATAATSCRGAVRPDRL